MNYDSPFIKMLETIANMLIVSFLWFLFSLPLFTIAASSAALFHTSNQIIFGPGRGKGVLKDFYHSFKENLIPGVKLSFVVVLIVLIVAEGLWTGYQIYKLSIWGLLYMILGIVLSFVLIPMIVYIPPVLSRFEAPLSTFLRMAAYFAMKKPVRSIFYTVMFFVMIFLTSFFPLAVVILPALYTDLIRVSVARDLDEMSKDFEEKEEESEEEEGEEETFSAFDFEEKHAKEKK